MARAHGVLRALYSVARPMLGLGAAQHDNRGARRALRSQTCLLSAPDAAQITRKLRIRAPDAYVRPRQRAMRRFEAVFEVMMWQITFCTQNSDVPILNPFANRQSRVP